VDGFSYSSAGRVDTTTTIIHPSSSSSSFIPYKPTMGDPPPLPPMAITLSSRLAAAKQGYPTSQVGSASSVYSDYVDSRSPSPLSSHRALYADDTTSDMDTNLTSNNSRAPSIFSYDSSRDGREMLKEENGRVFNNQNDTYYFPAGNNMS